MSAVVYVSGLPGIGKTTAVRHLATTRPSEYVRVSFGEALREIVDPDATHDAFRSGASRSVSRAVVEQATLRLADCIRGEATRVVLIDSHAVSPAPEGLRATPDTAARVATYEYSVIVHLSVADAQERVMLNGEHEGRNAITAQDVATAETIQLSIVARYASLCDCPLYVVSASGDPEAVADRISRAITAGLRWGRKT